MFKPLLDIKWLVTFLVVAVVLAGLVIPRCRQTVLHHTLMGVVVGGVHSLVQIQAARERARRVARLTRARVRKIVAHSVKLDTAVGLVVGASLAVLGLADGGA